MAHLDYQHILKQGVEFWNWWRKQDPHDSANLSFTDCSTLDLRNINFVGTSLEATNFRGADLRGGLFNYANCLATDFEGANLKGAVFTDAHLESVIFRDTNLQETKLYNASLIAADLSNANLNSSDLRNTTFFLANLSNTKLRSADLTGSDLRQANLSKATLVNANLHRAKLNESILENTVLVRANLGEANLTNANIQNANISNAILINANLSGANLHGSNLKGADLRQANCFESDFSKAILTKADLRKANFNKSILDEAEINNANMKQTQLLGTSVKGTIVSGSFVYAINVWGVKGEFMEQKDLIITDDGESPITIDNLKVAQFIYLILNNEEIRDVLNTLTSKAVLILGRFSIPKRKEVLDELKNKLRDLNFLPIVFDFDRPTNRDFTETIKTLAGLSYFVIADITNPKSSPLELQATIPDYQIPFAPIIQQGEQPFAMMSNLQTKYNWVLDTLSYDSVESLVKALKPGIIEPSIQKYNELARIKANKPTIQSAKDFI